MILNEAQKTTFRPMKTSFSSHLDNPDSDFQELNQKLLQNNSYKFNFLLLWVVSSSNLQTAM